jgi:hypothetical protein
MFATFNHLIGKTSLPFTIPLSWLGIGLKNYDSKMGIPNSLIWIGGLSCAYHLLKQLGVLKENVVTWIKSFFNAQKYLQPISDKYPTAAQDAISMRAPSSGPSQGAELNSQKSYAVIYGAGNKGGKAFAYYLMSKGFNLILIEREGDSLQALEE